jgi:hypothetical protein
VLNLRDKRKPRSADAETTKQWEVKGLAVEFEASGLEFCRDRGMALSTLRRHLKKHSPGGGGAKPRSRLIAVEVVKANRIRILERSLDWATRIYLAAGSTDMRY